MASTSEISNDVHAGLDSPAVQSPGVATRAVVSDLHAGGEETRPEPSDLPKVFDPEWQKEGMPDTEFYRKYPLDAWGEEMAPNARVWKIYRDQQELSHGGMLRGWNKTLDVLLIFAGLFSAVLTAFLIESYKSLQPDYTQYVATFVYAAAVQHNRTGGVFPALDAIAAPDRFIQTSASQRWTNGLWFSSLVISLSVALLCILIKQWLEEYDAHVSSETASPKYWARRHCLYHRGLRKWGVPGLISFLPLLLHLSLFLFFVGLILFLLPLDAAISYSLLVMVCSIAAFYLLSLVLPAWRIECPSYTPLFAQLLLGVSRAVSGFLYIKRRWNPVGIFARRKVDVFFQLMEQSLRPVRVHVRQQFARETRTISLCKEDLDAHVLSALIHLPTATSRDIITTAIAAMGAVRSTRSIELITRTVPVNDFHDIFSACSDNIPSTRTGFALTSHMRLCRANSVMHIGSDMRWSFAQMPQDVTLPGLVSLFGIDGLLLVATHFSDLHLKSHIDVLIVQLQSLPLAGDSSRGFPLRSTCLVFLDYFSSYPRGGDLLLSYLLLVFCAGRFASANMHECALALQSVEIVLGTHCSITIPPQNGGDAEYICAVINGLWHMLADFPRYRVDLVTAQLVAHQANECFRVPLIKRRFRWVHRGVWWAELSGLSAFARSPMFNQCVTTGDTLTRYILRFSELQIRDMATVQLEDYWECIAILLKLGWDRVPRPEYAACLSDPDGLFPVQPHEWNRRERLSRRGPYSTRDDWYEPVLSAFLTGQNAITTWTGANVPDHTGKSRLALASLARRVSVVLYRRQRLGRDNVAFIPSFFSGSFIFARFRDVVSREHISTEEDTVETIIQDLARHCLKLSPERFMAICAQLEETGDERSELRARAVAFAQGIRNDSTPGGALSAECSTDCPCMIDSAGPTPTGSGLTRWNSLVARFRPERNSSVASPIV